MFEWEGGGGGYKRVGVWGSSPRRLFLILVLKMAYINWNENRKIEYIFILFANKEGYA